MAVANVLLMEPVFGVFCRPHGNTTNSRKQAPTPFMPLFQEFPRTAFFNYFLKRNTGTGGWFPLLR